MAKDLARLHCPLDQCCSVADEQRERPVYLDREEDGRYRCLALRHYCIDHRESTTPGCLLEVFATLVATTKIPGLEQ